MLCILVLILVLYPILLIIYRLYFHPLAAYPGPKIAAATKWYEFYHDIIAGHGLFADKIIEMHKKYGPIIRINPDELHIDDADFYEVLYAGSPARRDKWPPAAKMAGTTEAGFGTVSHAIHSKRRAALSPLFSARAIASTDSIMQQQVQILSDAFRERFLAKKVIELRSIFVAFTMDTIHQYATGQSTEMQSDEERARRWWLTLEETSKVTPMAKQFPWMLALGQKVPLEWLRWLKPEMAGLLEIQHEMYARAERYLLHEEKSSSSVEFVPGTQKMDNLVFRTIRNSMLPPHEKSLDRLAQEAFTVIVAGAETTARMLELGVFYILTNPSVLARLQEEAVKAMPHASKTPSTKSLEDIPYLTATVKEILRISALVTSRLPLMAHEELRYRDWVIPPKTPIGMTPHDVLLDPRVFPAPHDFLPERWIQNPGLERYFVPFGKGTRMCQGMKFALAELNLALITLFRRFDLELYDTIKSRDVDYVGDGFLGAHHPDSVGVRVRVLGERR